MLNTKNCTVLNGFFLILTLHLFARFFYQDGTVFFLLLEWFYLGFFFLKGSFGLEQVLFASLFALITFALFSVPKALLYYYASDIHIFLPNAESTFLGDFFQIQFFYRAFLSLMVGGGLLFPCQIANALLFFSILFLYRYFMKEMRFQYSLCVFLCFCFSPVWIFYTIVPLRELLQVFFVSIFVMMGILFSKRSLKIPERILILFAMVGFVLSHDKNDYVLLMGAIFSGLTYLFFEKKAYRLLALLLGSLSFMIWIFCLVHSDFVFHAYIAAKTYTSYIPIAYSTYFIFPELHSMADFFYESIKSYLYYLFYPFLWTITDWKSLIGALIALERLIFLGSIFYYRKKLIDFLGIWPFIQSLGWYGILTYFYSLGTNNYGTSIRHQLLSDIILLIIIFPLFEKDKASGKENFVCIK